MSNSAASLDFSSKAKAVAEKNSRYKVYDFRIPKKFTKEDLNALNRITDTYSKLLSICLSGLTREPCTVYNPKIDEISSAAYLSSMPKYTMIGMLNFEIENSDLRDTGVMFHLPSDLGFFLIDILLGGHGQAENIERLHTDIEIAILRYLITKFADILGESWSSVVKAQFHYEKSETTPKLIDLKSDDDIKVVMSFDVNIKNIQESISIAYSAQFLEDLMGRMSVRSEEEIEEPVSTERDSQRRKVIFDSLSETDLELKAVLADMTLNMQDIMNLNVGDVIPLEKKITDDITVYVDEEPRFMAKLGQINIKKAVKLTEIIDADEE